MANTTNTTSYLDPPSLIGRLNNDGTISLTPLELKRMNDFNYDVSKMIQGGLNLANLNSATNEVFTDLSGNVTTLQATAKGLQSSVADAEGKATTAQQTAEGLSVSVSNLSGEVSTVSATINGLNVTTSGGTTYISGDHIKTGTIEGVTLVSREEDSVGTSLQSVTIENGQIVLKNSEGDTATISEAASGFKIAVSSAFSTGVTVTASKANFSGDINVSGDLTAGSANINGDLNVAQNIKSNGAMKLNAGGNASFDSGGTIYIGASSGYSGNVNIGQSGGTVNLNGTVKVNGVSVDTGSSTGGLYPTITVTAPTGSTVTAVMGATTLTATESSGTWVFNIPAYGTCTVNATLGTQSTSGTVVVDTVKQYTIELAYVKIYGISWSGGPSTAWTRTDDAAGFSDPVPALSNGSGSSPFDNCYPWNGMVKESRTGGVMVKIPKFWFKWTKSGSTLALQIADKAVSGFSVSPAHMDRGDGKGERDYVYIGRYHCDSNYLSATGSKPVDNITRASARSSIHAKGSTIWQMDYAMRLTIWMLMLVEFADNDFQTKIGYGCGDNSAAGAMGYTDSMTYHTGTTQSARTTYGLGTQYRYIEGLWDNVYDWMDGCYYSSSGMSVIKNPAKFSDTANGTFIGTPTSGYPSVMSLSTASGFEWCIYPTASAGSTTTYFPDNWDFNASFPCLYAGAYYGRSLDYGAFYVSITSASNADAGTGCRLQELP